MQSTDHLDETNLTKKNWEMITNLTAENEKYDQIKASINQFVEDPAIDSYGIRSLKRQLEDYLVIIDAIKNANDKDIRGYHSVNFILGDEYLDGNVVILREQEIEIYYKKHLLEKKYRMDIVVGDIIVELKSVTSLVSAHRAQLCNYLRLTRKPIGLLMNFGEESLVGERWAYDTDTNECFIVDRNMKPIDDADYVKLLDDEDNI